MGDYEVVNGVGILTCSHPPVNQLSYKLRIALNDGLDKALIDPNVKAIIIICDGKTFIAGADIKEFKEGTAHKLPITAFMKRLDTSQKPVIAAIHGTALGGGFELALSCHYRIGTSRCKVGLPEVLIGLLPGAGGTQRLPRLIGPLLAAEMICSGVHISADIAFQRGILDKIVNIGSNHKLSMERLILRQSAIRFALNVVGKPLGPRIISKRKCPTADPFFLDMVAAQSAKKARGFLAPQLCLEAVIAAQNSATFEDGIKIERKLFFRLATGSQARALQHLFFAQRQINKIPGINMKLAKKINSVGIIGCGTMGGGILMCFVSVGIPVVVLEIKEEYLDKGLKIVKGNWMRSVKKGRLTKAKYEHYLSLITPTTDYSALANVDLVIEAVFESLKVKEDVFRKLDSVCKPGCILASNTSFINIESIASVTSRPNCVIGTHFFAPANKMPLLENVRHKLNDETTIATVQSLGKLIRKKAVLVRTCNGFVGNRMWIIECVMANRLTLEGCLPSEIDAVLYNFGCAMGPFSVSDLSGLDIGYSKVKDPSQADSNVVKGSEFYAFPVRDILCEMKRYGLKTGKGYYDYPDMRTRKPVPSALVKKLILEQSARLGIVRRKFSGKEILKRIFYPMINEGTKILEEEIAIRPSDIDVVFVFGYAFPAFRGGIMHYADSIGFKNIRNFLKELEVEYPGVPMFKPSDLMNELADGKIKKLSKYWNIREKNAKSKL